MNYSDWISLIGTAVTILCTGISIWQAYSASKSNQSAQKIMNAVQFASIAERLKAAQEHIRNLPTNKALKPGLNIEVKLKRIRAEFDTALSSLPKSGAGSEARSNLEKAQSELNNYENSCDSDKKSIAWQSMQAFVQDAISELTSLTKEVGGKHGK